VIHFDGLVKSLSTGANRSGAHRPSVKPRPGVGVEPFEFNSNGGGGKILPRFVKRRILTFYEVINVESNT